MFRSILYGRTAVFWGTSITSNLRPENLLYAHIAPQRMSTTNEVFNTAQAPPPIDADCYTAKAETECC